MLYLNGEPVKTGKFPNMETYVDVRNELLCRQSHRITMKFEGNDDFINLMLLKKALDEKGGWPITLEVPYFPYSTMDHTDGSRALSLKYVAQFINSLNFVKVIAWEPHSTVLEALVDRVEVENTTEKVLANAFYKAGNKTILCFPDNGAAKRYEHLCKEGDKVLTFSKKRDFTTGKILGMQCQDDLSVVDKDTTCIIVDDLCRRGGTFMGCGKILKDAGAGEVILCVTHLEQGAFDGVLKDDSPVDKVFATRSCFVGSDPACAKLHLVAV